jgi:hypothetical protein
MLGPSHLPARFGPDSSDSQPTAARSKRQPARNSATTFRRGKSEEFRPWPSEVQAVKWTSYPALSMNRSPGRIGALTWLVPARPARDSLPCRALRSRRLTESGAVRNRMDFSPTNSIARRVDCIFHSLRRGGISSAGNPTSAASPLYRVPHSTFFKTMSSKEIEPVAPKRPIRRIASRAPTGTRISFSKSFQDS